MFFKTKEEKKSAIITTILFVIMLFVMSFAIFPPETKQMEGGGGGGTIALNFGFDQEGRSYNFSSPDPVVAPKQTTQTKSVSSQILTSENDDAVAIKDVPKKEISKKTNSQSKITTPTKPQPNKSVTDAIGNLLSGDGNSDKTGNQGSSNGKLNQQGYQSDGGKGTGLGGGNGDGQGIGTGSGYGSGVGSGRGSGYGNYKLSGRKALTMPAPEYKCNEEGTVIVEIAVDKNGKVIDAKPGVRGTTNMAECLVSIAKNAALQTKFDPSTTAPERQIGTIIYNFKLKK